MEITKHDNSHVAIKTESINVVALKTLEGELAQAERIALEAAAHAQKIRDIIAQAQALGVSAT